MAWVIDPNFDSTLTLSQATAPFDTTPGNRMLGLAGSGAAYRDEIDKTDIELSCEMFINTRGFGWTLPYPSAFLIGRRQPDGSCYVGTWTFPNLGLTRQDHATGTLLLLNIAISIMHYDGATDTFTTLIEEHLYEVNTKAIDFFELVNVRFRMKGAALTMVIMDSTNAIKILEAGTIDDTITASGNPGLGGQLFRISSLINRPISYMNNFNVSEV